MHKHRKTTLLLKIIPLLSLCPSLLAMESQNDLTETEVIATLSMADIRFYRAVNHNDPKKVADAIERGANIHLMGGDSMTALHRVAWFQSEETDDLVAIAQLLLDHGADPELRTSKNGHSALDFAIQSNLLRVSRLILRHNVNLFGKTHEGKTSFAGAIEKLSAISKDASLKPEKRAEMYTKQLAICDALIAKQCANHYKQMIQFLCCLKHSESPVCKLLYKNKDALVKPYLQCLNKDPIAPLLAIKDNDGKTVRDIWPKNKGLVFNHPAERIKKVALIIKDGTTWELKQFFLQHHIDFDSQKNYQLTFNEDGNTLEGNASFVLLKLASNKPHMFEAVLEHGANAQASHNGCSILEALLYHNQTHANIIEECCFYLIQQGALITPRIFQLVHQRQFHHLASMIALEFFQKGQKNEKPLFFFKIDPDSPNSELNSPRPVYQSGIELLEQHIALCEHEHGAFSQFAHYLARAQQSPLKLRYLIAHSYACFNPNLEAALIYFDWENSIDKKEAERQKKEVEKIVAEFIVENSMYLLEQLIEKEENADKK